MRYDHTTEPVMVGLPHTIKLMMDHELTVTCGRDLCRWATGEDGCDCDEGNRQAGQSQWCKKCTWRCDVRVCSRKDGAVNTQATHSLNSLNVCQAMLLGMNLPPHVAPTSRNQSIVTDECGAGSRQRQGIYSKPPGNDEDAEKRGVLSRFRWWSRWYCGFDGCPAVSFFGEDWDGRLVWIEAPIDHLHLCAPCVKHQRRPCDMGCCRPRTRDSTTSPEENTAQAHPPDLLPPVVPAIAQVTRNTPWASHVLHRATTELTANGVSTDPSPVRAWQVRNIAGKDRLAHGSFPTYVGLDQRSVSRQQFENPLIGEPGSRLGHDSSGKAAAYAAMESIRRELKSKGEDILTRVVDDGSDFHIVISTRYRAHLFAMNCRDERGDRDRDWSKVLPINIDGTGNVASKLDGKTVYLNGVGMRSPAATVPGMDPPGPLLVVAMLTTGTDAPAFHRTWMEWLGMVRDATGTRLDDLKPPAIMSDLDCVFLTPLANIYTGYDGYREYKDFVWEQSVSAYEQMVRNIRMLLDNGSTETDTEANCNDPVTSGPRPSDEPQSASIEGIRVPREILIEAKAKALDQLRDEVQVLLLACVAHTSRDVKDYFMRNREMQRIAKPRRDLLMNLMLKIVSRVENSPLFRGLENLGHFIKVLNLMPRFFEMADSVRMNKEYLDGHLIVREPTRQDDPTLFGPEDGARAFADTGGKRLEVVAVAHFKYYTFELKVNLFAHHVLEGEIPETMGRDTQTACDAADDAVDEILVANEGEDNTSDNGDDDDGDDDVRRNQSDPLSEDEPASIRVPRVHPPRRSARTIRPPSRFVEDPQDAYPPAPPNTEKSVELAFRARWVHRTSSGRYPLADIFRLRATRMLFSSPVIRADLFPSLAFGGNTSTAVELCWRELKRRGVLNLQKPLAVILRPFVLWFVTDQYRYDADTNATLLRTDEMKRAILAPRERLRQDMERKAAEAEKELEKLRRSIQELERRGSDDAQTIAQANVASGEIAVEATIDDALVPTSFSEDPNARTRWSRSAGREMDPPRRRERDEDVGVVRGGPASSSRVYAKKNCVVCEVESTNNSDAVLRHTAKGCPHGMCPSHCRMYERAKRAGEVTWAHQTVVAISHTRECKMKSHAPVHEREASTPPARQPSPNQDDGGHD